MHQWLLSWWENFSIWWPFGCTSTKGGFFFLYACCITMQIFMHISRLVHLPCEPTYQAIFYSLLVIDVQAQEAIDQDMYRTTRTTHFWANLPTWTGILTGFLHRHGSAVKRIVQDVVSSIIVGLVDAILPVIIWDLSIFLWKTPIHNQQQQFAFCKPTLVWILPIHSEVWAIGLCCLTVLRAGRKLTLHWSQF